MSLDEYLRQLSDPMLTITALKKLYLNEPEPEVVRAWRARQKLADRYTPWLREFFHEMLEIIQFDTKSSKLTPTKRLILEEFLGQADKALGKDNFKSHFMRFLLTDIEWS